MNFISFRRLKLFKNSPPRPKDDGEDPEGREKGFGFWRRLIRHPFFYLVIFVFIVSYFLSYAPPRALPKIEEGEIAAADIVSPVDLTIEDTETTAARKDAAAEAVLPVYVFDANSFLNTEEKVRQLFEFGRETLKAGGPPAKAAELQTSIGERFDLDVPAAEVESLIKAGFSSEIEETLVSLIGKVSSQGIIVSKNLFIRREPERGFLLIKRRGNERLTQVAEILDIRSCSPPTSPTTTWKPSPAKPRPGTGRRPSSTP